MVKAVYFFRQVKITRFNWLTMAYIEAICDLYWCILSHNAHITILTPQNSGQTCTGSGMETQACRTPVNGNWGQWSPWSPCVSGQQTRTRYCDSPPASNGGQPCVSSPTGGAQSQRCSGIYKVLFFQKPF